MADTDGVRLLDAYDLVHIGLIKHRRTDAGAQPGDHPASRRATKSHRPHTVQPPPLGPAGATPGSNVRNPSTSRKSQPPQTTHRVRGTGERSPAPYGGNAPASSADWRTDSATRGGRRTRTTPAHS